MPARWGGATTHRHTEINHQRGIAVVAGLRYIEDFTKWDHRNGFDRLVVVNHTVALYLNSLSRSLRLQRGWKICQVNSRYPVKDKHVIPSPRSKLRYLHRYFRSNLSIRAIQIWIRVSTHVSSGRRWWSTCRGPICWSSSATLTDQRNLESDYGNHTSVLYRFCLAYTWTSPCRRVNRDSVIFEKLSRLSHCTICIGLSNPPTVNRVFREYLARRGRTWIEVSLFFFFSSEIRSIIGNHPRASSFKYRNVVAV